MTEDEVIIDLMCNYNIDLWYYNWWYPKHNPRCHIELKKVLESLAFIDELNKNYNDWE